MWFTIRGYQDKIVGDQKTKCFTFPDDYYDKIPMSDIDTNKSLLLSMCTDSYGCGVDTYQRVNEYLEKNNIMK